MLQGLISDFTMNSSTNSTKSNQESSPCVPNRITLIDCIKVDAERYLASLAGERPPPVQANEPPRHINNALLLTIISEALEIIGDDPFSDDEE
mmetsp:Transcript_25982/g.49284  ORF Transcript_25982/g.49284 Transcript_25982/m.49284 type:complete len:93 (-) Transcript_25982:164-442(-)